jgi:hypothetical protein
MQLAMDLTIDLYLGHGLGIDLDLALSRFTDLDLFIGHGLSIAQTTGGHHDLATRLQLPLQMVLHLDMDLDMALHLAVHLVVTTTTDLATTDPVST